MFVTALLLFGFLHPLKIQSVKCATPSACVITLNRNVSQDTFVYVRLKSGDSRTVVVTRGTKDFGFFGGPGAEYAGASLKR
jgi:hypothetical protein